MTAGTLRGSGLLGCRVVDDDDVVRGVVLDVRIVQDGPVGAGADAGLRVDGLVIGRGRGIERLGLFQRAVHGPWLLEAIDRRVGRHRRYLRWDQLLDPLTDAPDGELHFRGPVLELPVER